MESEDGRYARLIEVACSRDPTAGLEAARELAALPDPDRFEAMTAILTSGNSLVTDLAAGAMAGYGEHGLDALIAALPASRPLSQVKIVSALEYVGSVRAAEPLMELLGRTDLSMLRTLIIQALGQIGAVQAAPLIRSFADDADHHVRERVRRALELLEKP
jgi:HEAT repeat protein